MVKTYIDTYKKRPSGGDKYIKILETWLSTQQTHYKMKKYIMATPEIYNLWTEFINNDNYKKYFNCV